MYCISHFFFVCCFSKSHLTTKTFPERGRSILFFSRIFLLPFVYVFLWSMSNGSNFCGIGWLWKRAHFPDGNAHTGESLPSSRSWIDSFFLSLNSNFLCTHEHYICVICQKCVDFGVLARTCLFYHMNLFRATSFKMVTRSRAHYTANCEEKFLELLWEAGVPMVLTNWTNNQPHHIPLCFSHRKIAFRWKEQRRMNMCTLTRNQHNCQSTFIINLLAVYIYVVGWYIYNTQFPARGLTYRYTTASIIIMAIIHTTAAKPKF